MPEQDWIAEATKSLETANKKITNDNKKNLKDVANIIKAAFAQANAEKDPEKKKEMQKAVQDLMAKVKGMTTSFQSIEKEASASIKLLKSLSK